MNVLYIHTHDTGRYIQPYGYNMPTPNLMELAKEGTLFRHAYSAAPTCSPSRSAMLTGMAPHSCGMIGLAHRGFQLNDYSQHLVQYLNQNGFESVLCGVQHEARNPKTIGYHHILKDIDSNEKNRRVDSVTEDITNAQLVADYIKSEKDKQFFLSLGLQNTHRIFPEISDEVDPNYVMPPFPFYDNEQNRKDMAGYMTSVSVVDQCVGMVMQALKESGHEADTLVIFTTDHGIAFANMKCNLYDTGIGVSLILKYPGNKRKGEALDTLVSQIDLYPTICDLLDLEQPAWLQGYSLQALLNRETDRVRNEIFSEVTYHAAYEPMRCVRTERYKLIKFFDNHDRYVPANMDDSLSKDFLLEHQYLQQSREKEMLFDHYLDPVERVNLVENQSYKKVYADLSSRLNNWMEETADPLLSEGKVPKPIGAKANKLSCISPTEKNFE
ncbi:sulfatase [Radiobacillus sp. PE A8.2]|uniref:sulfatase family protein n=1 Tax=Radiobacillus sp. PE A8.2 TaxID=3380349 RepID=UPI00388D5082